jgi:hypothetical protein
VQDGSGSCHACIRCTPPVHEQAATILPSSAIATPSTPAESFQLHHSPVSSRHTTKCHSHVGNRSSDRNRVKNGTRYRGPPGRLTDAAMVFQRSVPASGPSKIPRRAQQARGGGAVRRRIASKRGGHTALASRKDFRPASQGGKCGASHSIQTVAQAPAAPNADIRESCWPTLPNRSSIAETGNLLLSKAPVTLPAPSVLTAPRLALRQFVWLSPACPAGTHIFSVRA